MLTGIILTAVITLLAAAGLIFGVRRWLRTRKSGCTVRGSASDSGNCVGCAYAKSCPDRHRMAQGGDKRS